MLIGLVAAESQSSNDFLCSVKWNLLSLSWHCRGTTRKTVATTPRLSPGSGLPQLQLKQTWREATGQHPPLLHPHLQHSRRGAAGQHPPRPMQALGRVPSSVLMCCACASSPHGLPPLCQQCCRKKRGLIRPHRRHCPVALLGRLHLQRAAQLFSEMHSAPRSSPQCQPLPRRTDTLALQGLTKQPPSGSKPQRKTLTL